jgi:hypothetical protein
MKLLNLLLGIMITGMISGCATDTKVISSAGTIGPVLQHKLPQNQRILVLSALRDTQVNIISENIFLYQELGIITIPAPVMNLKLAQAMVSKLKRIGYTHVDAQVINDSNALNTADINNISPEAAKALSEYLRNKNVDSIILLTQNSGQPLIYDLKCELAKNNAYRHASIQPHLYLYKIYVINAHDLKILTWITGSANGNVPNTGLCKPQTAYSAEDISELHSILLDQLRRTVSEDLSKTLLGSRKKLIP